MPPKKAGVAKKTIEKKAPASKAKKAATPSAAAAAVSPKKAPAKGKKKAAAAAAADDNDAVMIDTDVTLVGKKAPAAKGKKASASAAAAAGVPVRLVDNRCTMGGCKVYNDFDCMLNQTNISHNNNKFYVIQLLQSGSDYFVWNRWGRVGEDGQNALKGPMGLAEAKKEFEKKFRDKTANSWGSRDSFSAVAGKYTLIKLKTQVAAPAPPAPEAAKGGKKGKGASAASSSTDVQAPSKLPAAMQDFVRYIFFEAKAGLTKSIDANITDNGIETPLGVLSLEQVERGEEILDEAFDVFKSKKNLHKLKDLSSAFYTAIPHRFGRNVPPVIDKLEMFNSEYEVLALMKDMVKVTNQGANILNRDDPDKQLASLGCEISIVPKDSAEHKKVCAEIVASQKASHGTVFVKVKNVYKVRRDEEHSRYNHKVGGERTLYHGSRIANWVGLLSRGILMPKVVVAMGVHRTDPGWLGNGIYFGNADTAAGYAGTGHKGTAFMLMLTVALGKMKDYENITYGLTKPPAGFNSCHGVAGTEFYDDEYVVYDEKQQRIDYLVEFATK